MRRKCKLRLRVASQPRLLPLSSSRSWSNASHLQQSNTQAMELAAARALRCPYPRHVIQSLHAPLGTRVHAHIIHLGDCQNYGPFLGPYYNTGPNTGPNLGDPKRDHNFDNPAFILRTKRELTLHPDHSCLARTTTPEQTWSPGT